MDPQTAALVLESQLSPWRNAISNPEKAQQDVLQRLMTLGSAPGINTQHAAALKALYGPVAIREIYGTTEGMFGQQLDQKRAWVPNYDLFSFDLSVKPAEMAVIANVLCEAISFFIDHFVWPTKCD